VDELEKALMAVAEQRRIKDIACRKSERRRAAAWRRATARRQREALTNTEPRRKSALEPLEQQRKSIASTSGASAHVRMNLARLVCIIRTKMKTKMMRTARLAKELTAERRRKFLSLSEDERRTYLEVFELFDTARLGTLGEEQVQEALLELGVRGLDATEKREVARIRREALRGNKDTYEFLDFAIGVAEASRRALGQMRMAAFKKYLDMCSRGWDGELVLEHVLLGARAILPLELLDDEDECPVRAELMAQVRLACRDFVLHEEKLPDFVQELIRVGEVRLRHDVIKQRRVQVKRGLTVRQCMTHRHELVALDELFTRVDADQSGSLDGHEVFQLFKELGVVPRSSTEQRQVTSMLSDVGQANFAAFLDLVGSIRAMYERQTDLTLEEEFKKRICQHGATPEEHRVSVPGLLELIEVTGIMKQMPAPPVPSAEKAAAKAAVTRLHALKEASARRVRDDVGRILLNLDPDGVELFTYAEVRRVCHHLLEHIRNAQNIREERLIRRLGFSSSEVHDFRGVFEELDKDGFGTLEERKVNQALKMLGITFEKDFLAHMAFCMADANRNGVITFFEFLHMMKMVRDKEGPFRDASAPVSSLEELGRVDLVLLLDCFAIPPKLSDGFETSLLLNQASEMLGIGTKVPLGPVLDIGTMRDLLDYARTKAGTY